MKRENYFSRDTDKQGDKMGAERTEASHQTTLFKYYILF